ncbi:macrofage activating glycoprotein [Coprinopsis cinerea okayama7|uniref:Macrofage activating glycoprotein n=1 Tax=Coprinopsis cinerea (strain Okayama-7 / 130 / ATCC MYA-4618 / FGSC 9003) TaxID=240176 RepID=A8NVK7_COPC7|nr:macrofage activating glycoprotein [Coprinopsis cinerea okayama7\|eukprot:XP_001836673.2 macrofage activating glycoprotein [Coprinopsis cinerea okayama7\
MTSMFEDISHALSSISNAIAGLVGAALITGAYAQTPEFQGELLLQPQPNNAKCLTASSNSDGAPVVIATCVAGGSPSQKWVFSGGTVRVHGNKCLDVTDGVDQDGTKLQIWTCSATGNSNQQWYYSKWDNTLAWTGKGNTGYLPTDLPNKSQNGQYGTNNCGTGSSQSSNCQTAWINSATDFCLYGPPSLGTIGDTERFAVSYCTKSGRGTRTIPDGTLQGVHFVRTPEYVQITGVGDFTKMNIPFGDDGGEMDNRGADGKGNPIGGLLFGNTFGSGLQYHEWTQFISYREFCIRACIGPRSKQLCNHIYDIMGCWWNIPANYSPGVYEECQGDPAIPMGVYGTSTWYQGVSPTPPPHPAPASSSCSTLSTVGVTPLRRSLPRRDVPLEGGHVLRDYVEPHIPRATSPPM